jgi:chromosome segregation protein
VGLFEGKKIGRAKNLEKLAEQIVAQPNNCRRFQSTDPDPSYEVIAFNQDLKENVIRETEREIS